ncbi:aminotransferase class I/II-fold pyridoxal phosphate-dependent enzyme [Phormidium sp. CCY1219]|uniref:aminotransferase class I/II-fold pyridoxal phosphate-dependent enzyme n=1 Tax=Phormidium sp. CCY1219 TaxID=2886104 RepID=UPI002D1F789C|nr:aminotransferase class I/II-fold pyridoxal phosphate-dependent enzyme [Phormidium sp. CCY1219]MEB3826349.1 aminotransferase class I/II-fold pyridoxal phosphate-dependent enzyme [Phormidium sp. CCY1219]
MVNSQSQAPLLETLQHCARSDRAPFYAPGHKGGRGIAQSLGDLCGQAVFQADLPELPELDNLFAPQGAIAQAQQLAAQAFGADRTWFSVNGSTGGAIAGILATLAPGEKIILPRNTHQSAISGLILSGAVPVFINPEYHPEWDLPLSITPEAVAAALAQHPDAKAVMMVYPTYQGICGDIEAIADIVHQQGIPLLVDEAHGPHFAFHPDLPTPALQAGADLSVQSIHKVLGAMTQASMLHLQGHRIDPQRISAALQLIHSTSPSYLLLASLDAARRQMALHGEALMERTLNLADDARARLEAIQGISVLESSPPKRAGFDRGDRTRLTVKVTQLGLNGYQADEILHEKLGVTCELPSARHLTFIISLGNRGDDIERLVAAFKTLSAHYRRPPASPPPCPPAPLPARPLSPREAFFAPVETVEIRQCVGRISAELVCPYPPGIPVLMPGETICAAAIDYLQQVRANGGRITGLADPTLQTIQAIAG